MSKAPRRTDVRVRMPNQASTMFSQEAPGRGEVKVNPGMGLLPRPDLGHLVGERVVEDDMQIALVVTASQAGTDGVKWQREKKQ